MSAFLVLAVLFLMLIRPIVSRLVAYSEVLIMQSPTRLYPMMTRYALFLCAECIVIFQSSFSFSMPLNEQVSEWNHLNAEVSLSHFFTDNQQDEFFASLDIYLPKPQLAFAKLTIQSPSFLSGTELLYVYHNNQLKQWIHTPGNQQKIQIENKQKHRHFFFSDFSFYDVEAFLKAGLERHKINSAPPKPNQINIHYKPTARDINYRLVSRTLNTRSGKLESIELRSKNHSPNRYLLFGDFHPLVDKLPIKTTVQSERSYTFSTLEIDNITLNQAPFDSSLLASFFALN